MEKKFKDLLWIGLFINSFEWYDYTIFGFSVYYLGRNYFHASSPYIAVLTGFLVFASGFVLRPVGAILGGIISYKYSPAHVLNMCIFFMAVPAFLIGILPTYASIGIGAPIILVILRVFQGIGSGAEASSSYSYMSLQKTRSRFLISIAATGATYTILLASLVILVVQYTFTKDEILLWAWRIPFWLSIPITIIILFVRRKMYLYIPPIPLLQRKGFVHKIFVLDLISGIVLSLFYPTLFFGLMFWLPTYLTHVAAIDFAKNLHVVGLLWAGITMPLVGIYLKNWNLQRIFVGTTLFTIGFILISFIFIPTIHNHFIFVGIFIIYGSCIGILLPTAFNLITSFFHKKERTMGVALSMALCNIIAGFLPISMTYISKTHSLWMASLLMVILGLLSLGSIPLRNIFMLYQSKKSIGDFY